MRIVFEGSEKQIERLKDELNKLIIREDQLPTLREDFQTETLWCVQDVKRKYDCTDKEALVILESALTADATMSEICFSINTQAELAGLKKRI